MQKRLLFFHLVCALFILANCKDNGTNPEKQPPAAAPEALQTHGRWIETADGEKIILRGVNIASLEWTSMGENMLRSIQEAVDVWRANLLRIPLSQDRWFGKASEQNDEGKGYQRIVDQIVKLCNDKKVYVLLELHWNDAGYWGQYIGQHRMPDKNSAIFLQALAKKYANHPAVLFGLYNEPHDVSWDVWLNGGTVRDNWDRDGSVHQLEYQAMGHQALYDSVRQAGATENLIVIGGLDWGYDLTGVLGGYAINGINIIYDTHCYPWKSRDWDKYFGDIGEVYPVLVGEWGGSIEEGDQGYGISLANYLRSHLLCWTAWCFHPSAGPTLIKNWDYEPTAFGKLVKAELEKTVEISD